MYQQTRIRGNFGGNYAAGSAAIDPRTQQVAPAPQAHMQEPSPQFNQAPDQQHSIPAQQYSTSANNYPVNPPAPAPSPEYNSDEGHYGEEMDQGPSYPGQVCNLGGRDKFLSFHNKLNLSARQGSYEADYAAIHGAGGSKHAVKSRIEARMCDYTNGTGEGKSITTTYNLEPYYLLYLLECVRAAMHGNLHPVGEASSDAIRARAYAMVDGWLRERRPPTYDELMDLRNLLAFDPSKIWSDFREKNNPYGCKPINVPDPKDPSKTVPIMHTKVSTFHILYNPTRNYAWTITISNFWAPFSKDPVKGTNSHNSKKALDTKKVTISATTADLFQALTHVEHFINQWERRAFPMLNAMCIKEEQEAAAWRQQQQQKNK